MKKYHFKTFYSPVICILAVVLFYSCDRDNIMVEDVNQTGQTIINRLSEEQLKVKVPIVFDEVQSLRRKIDKSNLHSRGVAIPGGYDVETDEVLEIIVGQVKTYTFAITTDSDENSLKNLVIKVDQQSNLHGGILEYNLSAEEIRLLKLKIPINLSQKVGWKFIDSLSHTAGLLLRSDIDCLKTTITGGPNCPSGLHNIRQMQHGDCSIVNAGDFTPSPETVVQIFIDLDCLNGNSGGGGPEDGGGIPGGDNGWYGPAWYPQQIGSSGSGGGAGQGDVSPEGGGSNEGHIPNQPEQPSPDISDNTFYTQPLLPQDKKNTPCDELNKLKGNPVFVYAIDHLKLKAPGLKEYAWVFKYFNGSNSLAPPTVAGHQTLNPNRVNLDEFLGLEWIGAFHNHTKTDGAISMFSPEDVGWLFLKAFRKRSNQLLNNRPVDVNDLFLGLVNTEGVYCLKVKDIDKFIAFAVKYSKFKKDLGVKYKKIGSNATQEQLQVAFLKLLKEVDAGVGLYEQEPSGDWNELNLDPLDENNAPIKKPCT